jgi:ribosomal protein L22
MAKKRVVYFTKETQDAIVKYNNTDDVITRNYLYTKYIHKPMRKIIENVIHKYKFHHSGFDTMNQYISEIESSMLEKIKLYDPERGRAYSYFTKAIRINLIIHNKIIYNKLINKASYDEVDNSDLCYKRFENNSYIKEELRTDYYTDEFLDFIELNLDKFYITRMDISTANAIVSILRRRFELDIFDKKALYIYVKNIVKVSNQKFLDTFNIIRREYYKYRELHNSQDLFDFSSVDLDDYSYEESEIDLMFRDYNG